MNIKIIFAFLILSTLLIAGCSSQREVKNLEPTLKKIDSSNSDSIEKTATDIGITKPDSNLVDLGNLNEPQNSVESTATNMGVDKVDSNLTDIGQLI